MTEMFIDTIQERYPCRVLLALNLEYMGFSAYFDLPKERRIRLSIHAYAKGEEELQIYETAYVSDRSRYVEKPHAASPIIKGRDPLPVLSQWLRVALGGEECSYEGSFAEFVLSHGVQREVKA